MTVRDLIASLQQFHPDRTIVMRGPTTSTIQYDVEEVVETFYEEPIPAEARLVMIVPGRASAIQTGSIY
jgi:nitrogenase molybdenum-iron protein alpha/beta subunit